MKKRHVTGWVLACGLTALVTSAWAAQPAEIPVENYREFVPLRLQHTIKTSPLQQEMTTVGSPFSITLDETVRLQDQVLPKDTRLEGTVVDVRQSKRWGRPAYVAVRFERVCAPGSIDSVCHPLSFAKEKHGKVKFYRNRRHSGDSLVGRQAAIALGTYGITIPLFVVAEVSLPLVIVIDNTVEATIGAIQEVSIKDPDDMRTRRRKLVVGAVRGATGIPTLVDFCRLTPDIDYSANQRVVTRLPKRVWQSAAASSANLPASQSPTPGD